VIASFIFSRRCHFRKAKNRNKKEERERERETTES